MYNVINATYILYVYIIIRVYINFKNNIMDMCTHKVLYLAHTPTLSHSVFMATCSHAQAHIHRSTGIDKYMSTCSYVNVHMDTLPEYRVMDTLT